MQDENKKKNKLICFGYTGSMVCYLNLDEDEAIKRYAEYCGVNDWDKGDAYPEPTIVEFDDQFGAYAVYE